MYRRKPAVRAIYDDLFHRIVAALGPGRTVEVGGGGGMFKAFAGDVISSDIVAAPWLDVVADAQALPFADGGLGNLVVFDVLHHMQYPARFFREAQRVLTPGGRVVLMEPAITPVSGLFLRLFHEEPVIMDADPWTEQAPVVGRDPFAANQAIPTLMLRRQAGRFGREFPGLAIRETRLLSLTAYPLSGGFQPWSLLPAPLTRPLLVLERMLLPWLGRLAAFRLFAVIERLPSPVVR